jgi:uncharacterized membrane protein
MKKKYLIRYNTQSTDDHNRWRLLDGETEILVSDIIVDTKVQTSKDYIEGVGDKFHISCEGVLIIKNNIAYISRDKTKLSIYRHILKAITYRMVGTLTTIAISYAFTRSIELSSMIGVVELIIKPTNYFIHERIWYRIKFGKT